jgi:hypothetical protein
MIPAKSGDTTVFLRGKWRQPFAHPHFRLFNSAPVEHG